MVSGKAKESQGREDLGLVSRVTYHENFGVPPNKGTSLVSMVG